MSKTLSKRIAFSAIIAALYASCTILTSPIAFGFIQFRIAEALTILPLLMIEGVYGLFIGCLIANIYTGNIFEIVLGSSATLIAAILTRVIGKCFLKNKEPDYLLKTKKITLPVISAIPPIILNALIVPLILIFGYGESNTYLLYALSLLISQSITIFILGTLLFFAVRKYFHNVKLIN